MPRPVPENSPPGRSGTAGPVWPCQLSGAVVPAGVTGAPACAVRFQPRWELGQVPASEVPNSTS